MQELIKANFDDGRNFRFRVNSNCGLHVHVSSQKPVEGKMKNAGIPFQVVRNRTRQMRFRETDPRRVSCFESKEGLRSAAELLIPR